MTRSRQTPRKWLLLIPLLIGIGIFVFLLKSRSVPEQSAPTEQARAVRIIPVPEVTVIPRATGYGTVTPDRTWEAVAEVSGKITELHKNLKKGELLKAGATLLKIDPSDYQLALARAQADIKATEAQLAELSVKEANIEASLEIEQQALDLSEQELKRKQALVKSGTVTRSQLEQEQRTVLAQRQSVQAQQNALNLIPSERQLLLAQLARYQAQLGSARLDLAHTMISLPFDARIAEVRIEQSEFVRQGDVLLVADSIRAAEITAQFPVNKLRPLIQPKQQALTELDNETARRVLGFSAEVRIPNLPNLPNLPNQIPPMRWDAEFVRASDAVDERTRTLGIVVAVQEPYRQARPGIRPPLVKGMFAEVELRGAPRPESLIIPRAALHGDQVYLLDEKNRLQRRTVSLAFTQGNFAVVAEGLQAGEQIIVSDLLPAIDNMLLQPRADPDLLAQLQLEASGEAP